MQVSGPSPLSSGDHPTKRVLVNSIAVEDVALSPRRPSGVLSPRGKRRYATSPANCCSSQIRATLFPLRPGADGAFALPEQRIGTALSSQHTLSQ